MSRMTRISDECITTAVTLCDSLLIWLGDETDDDPIMMQKNHLITGLVLKVLGEFEPTFTFLLAIFEQKNKLSSLVRVPMCTFSMNQGFFSASYPFSASFFSKNEMTGHHPPPSSNHHTHFFVMWLLQLRRWCWPPLRSAVCKRGGLVGGEKEI